MFSCDQIATRGSPSLSMWAKQSLLARLFVSLLSQPWKFRSIKHPQRKDKKITETEEIR
jgi:hypothetical protein